VRSSLELILVSQCYCYYYCYYYMQTIYMSLESSYMPEMSV